MTDAVKLQVALRQTPAGKLKSLVQKLDGSARSKIKLLLPGIKCPVTGDVIGEWSNVRFDHRPAIWERRYDTEANDTIPPSNSVTDIEALSRRGHDIRTHGHPGERRGNGKRRGTTVGSDSHRRAKIARITHPKPKKPGRKIKNRPMGKGRGFPQRGARS